MKRILITSTDLMMTQFLIPHVIHLSRNGYEIELACSEVGERMTEVEEKLDGFVMAIHRVRLKRSPFSITNLSGLFDLKRILKEGHFDIVWANEPVMGVVTRIVSQKYRKHGLKVIYMAHGFHFYNGAPLINWITFYPVEKFMARYADIIITVNTEDYARAKTFNVEDVKYIHGIGINTDRLTPPEDGRGNIREELGLGVNDFVLLSIGELNKNKNQGIVIKALALMNNPHVHYLLCGKGKLLHRLSKLVNELGLDGNVHFLGYRKDVVDICSQVDLFVMPSFREGLPVSSLEAMYCGLPLLTSDTRGLVDVNKDGENGFLVKPTDATGFERRIKEMSECPELRKDMGSRNREKVLPFTINNTKIELLNIINGLDN